MVTNPAPSFSRRQLLGSAVASGAVLTLPRWGRSAELTAETVELDRIHPMVPNSEPWARTAYSLANTQAAATRIVARAAAEYRRTKNLKYMEQALMFGFIHFRFASKGGAQIKVAQQYRKFAELAIDQHPNQACGYVWGSMFIGLEMLSRGILNSLNMLPLLDEKLKVGESKYADYYHGMAPLMRGKVLIKAPPFPVSVGDFKRGMAILDKAGKHMMGSFAQYHPIYAEAKLLTSGPDEALKVLDQLDDVVPPDLGTNYLLQMARHDAKLLRQAIKAGKYDRYTFDVLTYPIPENLPYTPSTKS